MSAYWELTFSHAKARALVTFADPRTGATRTGRLVFLPPARGRGRPIGRKARVQIPGGAVLSVDPRSLALAEEDVA